MISAANSNMYAGDQGSNDGAAFLQSGMPSSSLVDLALLLNNIGVARMDQRDYREAFSQLGHAQDLLRQSCHRVSLNAGMAMNAFHSTETAHENSLQLIDPQAQHDKDSKNSPTIDAPNTPSKKSSSVTEKFFLGPLSQSPAAEFRTNSTKSPRPPRNLFQRSEYDEGMHVLRRGVRLHEDLLGCHTKVKALSKFGASAECMDHALLLLTVTYNLGQVYHAFGECEAAFEHFTCALRQYDLYKEQHRILEERDGSSAEFHFKDDNIPTQFAILRNIGYLLYERSQFNEAMAAFMEALALIEITRGEDSWDAAITLNCIGVLHFHMPDPKAEEAMFCYAKSIDILRKLDAKDGMEVDDTVVVEAGSRMVKTAIGTALNNVGRVHYLRGNYTQAMKVYKEALDIRKTVLGADSLDVAATVYNTGQTYHQLGALDEAIKHYHDFLRIALATFGDSHRDVAIMIRCIAQIHHEKGDFEKAAELYREALQSARSALGNLHPEIASTLNKLGNLYYEQGDLDKAMDSYQEGLQVERQVLERDHPNITVTLSNIGQIYKQYGEYEKAVRYYKEALCLQKQRLGPSHPNVAITLSSIGMIYYQLDDYNKALDLYQEALCLRREALGDEHLDVSATLNSIGMVLFKKGRHNMAMEAFTKAYSIRKSILGEVHRDVAIILHNIATIHLQRGDDDTAMAFYKETLRIEKAALGEHHVDVSLTLHHIGQMLQSKGDMEFAVIHFKQALYIEERRLGYTSLAVAKSVNGLGNIALQRGQVTEALQYFARAARIYKKLGRNEDSLVIVGLNLYTIGLVHPDASPAA